MIFTSKKPTLFHCLALAVVLISFAAVSVQAQVVTVESRTSLAASNSVNLGIMSNPPYQELAGTWTSSANKSTAGGTTGVGSRFVSVAGTPAFKVIPTLVDGATYVVEVTHSSANSPSTDLVVAVGQTGCAGLPATTDGFKASRGANQWYRVGVMTVDTGVTQPEITFTYQSGTISGSARFYADAIRFTPVNLVSSNLWAVGNTSAWLTAANWSDPSVPSSVYLAQIGSNPTNAATGVGINMNTASGLVQIGAIEVTSARTNNLFIGNPATIQGGTLQFFGITVNGVPNTILRNNGSDSVSWTIQNTQSAGTQTMPLDFSTSGSAVIDATKNITISSSIIKADQGITKIGAGTLTLSSTNGNAYTGDTLINVGTLDATQPAVLGSGNVSVASGATLSLSASNAINPAKNLVLASGTPAVILAAAATNTVNELSFDGGSTFQAPGTWGAVGSGATHTDTRFSGPGILVVTTGPVAATTTITGIQMVNGTNTLLSFQGPGNTTNHIESTTNLPPSWVEIGTVVAPPNGAFQFTDTNGLRQSQFYRSWRP